ncbi:hypothetical protein ACFWGM_38495, partial [Streptomyces roseolus]
MPPSSGAVGAHRRPTRLPGLGRPAVEASSTLGLPVHGPDGQGTFLYIAGIHARGSGGVVHWLNHELANVHRELKARRFSTLVQSNFDPETLEIVSSKRITPFYRPEGS